MLTSRISDRKKRSGHNSVCLSGAARGDHGGVGGKGGGRSRMLAEVQSADEACRSRSQQRRLPLQ